MKKIDLLQPSLWTAFSISMILALLLSACSANPSSNASALALPQQQETLFTVTTETPGTQVPTSNLIGTIHGKIILPEDMSLPDGLSVNLQGFDSTLQQRSLTTTVVQADGTYLFSNVEMPSDLIFMTTVVVNNLTFSSDVFSSADGTDLDMPITVYHSSTDSSVLVVDHLFVFMDFSISGLIQVVELYVISNPTDKVIVPASGMPIMSFELPANATDLQFQMGNSSERYIMTDNGFGDRQPVMPGSGQNQDWFAFDLPYSQNLDLSLPITLPVNAAFFLLPVNAYALKSNYLVDSGTQNVEGQYFHVYSSSNLSPGTSLDMSISNSPGSTPAGQLPGSATNILVGIGIFLIALIIAGLFVARNRAKVGNSSGQESIQNTGENLSDEDDANNLIDAIAALDDLYKDRKIPEFAYQQRRTEMKSRLKKIIQKSGMQLK